MGTRKICFIGKRNSYEKVFYGNIEDPTLEVTFLDDKIVANKYKYFERLPASWRKYIQFNFLKNYFKNNPETHFFFHEREKTLKTILKYLKKYDHKNFRGYLLIRNPMSTRQTELLSQINIFKSYNVYVGTFDYNDSKEFNLSFYNQYISKVNSLSTNHYTYDFGFLGRNKNRKGYLESIEKYLNKEGFSSNFKIIDSVSEIIPYTEYLKFILDSKCFIDIVQENQSGLTLRPIEALMYNRKLLTNNYMIKSMDFYNPNNIMFFDGQKIDHEELKDFMDKPLIKVPDSVLENYTTANVLKNIIDSHQLN